MYDLKSFFGNRQQLRSIDALEMVEVTSARHKLTTESSREIDKTTIPNDGAASIVRCTRRRLDMLNKHSSRIFVVTSTQIIEGRMPPLVA